MHYLLMHSPSPRRRVSTGARPSAPVFVVAIYLSLNACAAQSSPSPWIQMSLVQVDPAMIEEYVALQRDLIPHLKKAGTSWRYVSRTDAFGDLHRFIITNPVQSLSGFDSAKQDPELTGLIKRAQKYVRSQQSFAIRTIPEIDHPLPEKQRPGLIVVNLVRVAPGREQDYLELMKAEFLPHFRNAEIHHTSGSLAFGGEGGFLHLFHVKDFARLDEGSPVVRALGAKGAQAATAKFSGLVTSNELWIARLIPEASYGPWSAAPSK